ncbi:MAG: TSUP family transporter [Gemmatimonadetes bacterium]|nr:TSUP family transporter [Gemmatimonadota bacterium]NIO31192.1 TSUP family transporter [Gemmatimonadota bacterium]
MTPFELVAAAGAAALGALVQGSVGIGLSLVAVPLLLLIDPSFVPGPVLCVAIVLTLLLSHRERRSIDFHGVAWVLVGRIPGTLLGAAALVMLAGDVLTVLFGVLVLLAVAFSSFRVRVEPKRWILASVGVLSGFMGTTAALGGPPVALLLQNLPGARLRGTLSGIFLVGASVALLALVAVGRFGRHELILALALLPGILLGFGISGFTAPLLDRGYTRTVVLVVASGAALVAIGRQVL